MILYLCSMKKEEMIALLQQQNSFLQQQLQEANRKADRPFGGDYVVEKPS